MDVNRCRFGALAKKNVAAVLTPVFDPGIISNGITHPVLLPLPMVTTGVAKSTRNYTLRIITSICWGEKSATTWYVDSKD